MRLRYYNFGKQSGNTPEVLMLFHHVHHDGGKHEVHHCGGLHAKGNYMIRHCKCGKHAIDKQTAVGHATADKAVKPVEITITFSEVCPEGGWHVESGVEDSDKTRTGSTMKILKSLDPEYLIHRTATDQIVGVLADRDLEPLVGDEMMLADGEVDKGAEPQAYAVVKLRKGVKFGSGEEAVTKLGEKIDPYMAATYGASVEPVWFHPLASVEAWEESCVVKGLEVPVRIQKIAATDPDEAAVRDLSAEQLGAVARLLDSQQDLDGAEQLAFIVKSEYDRRGLEADEELKILKAVWSTKYINTLPDSSFLYIAPGGEKDEEGKTVPRTLRNFPVRDENGKLDLPHLRNAIGRIPQSNAPGLDAAKKKSLQDKARKLLEEAQKKN